MCYWPHLAMHTFQNKMLKKQLFCPERHENLVNISPVCKFTSFVW